MTYQTPEYAGEERQAMYEDQIISVDNLIAAIKRARLAGNTAAHDIGINDAAVCIASAISNGDDTVYEQFLRDCETWS